MDDAFKLLDLPETATREQVIKAYRKKANEMHPDKGGSTTEFNMLYMAYSFAIQACKKPIPCAKCGGVGFAERASGWRVARIVCPDCGGVGTIARGGGP